MLSLKDCLDYCDLTEEEVSVIAWHEHLPYPCAVELACCLVQSQEGTEVLRCLLKNAVCDAERCRRPAQLQTAREALRQFAANHPEA